MITQNSRPPFTAAIVGGSVGGLATAIELKDGLGAKVAVYERSAGEMQARGAGVVMQQELHELLQKIGILTESVCVKLDERVSLQKDGATQRQSAPQLMTAWDTLYKTMRTHLVDDCYRKDSELVRLTQTPDDVFIAFADGYEATADILIGADGVNSATRKLLTGINESAKYSGYIAWRGLENEGDLPAHLVETLSETFTSYMSPGMQMLCYLVPGADGSTERGSRRVNWVWYVNTPQSDLVSLMTGKTGETYRSFLPPGQVKTDVHNGVLEHANNTLPALFRELVEASTLFMQPVQDVDIQKRMYERTFLIGDAAGTVRPHTASGTSKAFGDAALLADALRLYRTGQVLPLDRLDAWEAHRSAELAIIARHGHRLAANSGLGLNLD